MATQKFTNFEWTFSVPFEMHIDMTAVTMQSNRIILNEAKAN